MIDGAAHDEHATPGSDRSFGLVFAGFFGCLGAVALWQGRPTSWVLFAVAVIFGILGVAMPRVLAPLNRLWFRFGMLLAQIVQPIVLGAVFFLVVTPIGLLLRVAGKDVLRLRRDPAATTYWIRRDPAGPAPDTMIRQF